VVGKKKYYTDVKLADTMNFVRLALLRTEASKASFYKPTVKRNM
jgi:hypothetical protein